MRLKQFFILLIGILLISQSCTVEKRLHKRGYYVEWKSFRKVSNKQIEKNELTEISLATETTNDQVEISIDEAINGSTPSETFFSEKQEKTKVDQKLKINKKSYPEKKPVSKPKNDFVKKVFSHLNQKQTTVFKEGENNRMARIGFIMAMSSLLLYFLIIPALFVSAVALKQIAREPKRYNNKHTAITAYVLSLILFSLSYLLLMALLSFITFTSVVPLIYMACGYLGIVVGSLVVMNV